MRRLERQALPVLGQLGFELVDAHAGRRRDDQLGRLCAAAPASMRVSSSSPTRFSP